jgi:hypothetical protein
MITMANTTAPKTTLRLVFKTEQQEVIDPSIIAILFPLSAANLSINDGTAASF